jgi:hypothetical protein
MTGLVDAIVNSIASAEGFFVNGAIPNRDDNPGDLRAAPWLTNPVIVDGFWKAATVAEGIAGVHHQVALDIARGYSLRTLIYAWAPPTDHNQTEIYLHETVRRLGVQGFAIDPEKQLWLYLDLKYVA